MHDLAAALCNRSLYQSISLSCVNACLWPEPPGGASYKVCPCGPGRDTRIPLLQRHPHAVAQYSDTHKQHACAYLHTSLSHACSAPRRACNEEGLPQGRSDTVHWFMRHHQASARMSEALGSACLARRTDQITLRRSTFPSWAPTCVPPSTCKHKHLALTPR